MKADWETIYREGDIASRAGSVVGQLWIKAESGTEGEEILNSVRNYLYDRADIAFEFCGIVNLISF